MTSLQCLLTYLPLEIAALRVRRDAPSSLTNSNTRIRKINNIIYGMEMLFLFVFHVQYTAMFGLLVRFRVVKSNLQMDIQIVSQMFESVTVDGGEREMDMDRPPLSLLQFVLSISHTRKQQPGC